MNSRKRITESDARKCNALLIKGLQALQDPAIGFPSRVVAIQTQNFYRFVADATGISTEYLKQVNPETLIGVEFAVGTDAGTELPASFAEMHFQCFVFPMVGAEITSNPLYVFILLMDSGDGSPPFLAIEILPKSDKPLPENIQLFVERFIYEYPAHLSFITNKLFNVARRSHADELIDQLESNDVMPAGRSERDYPGSQSSGDFIEDDIDDDEEEDYIDEDEDDELSVRSEDADDADEDDDDFGKDFDDSFDSDGEPEPRMKTR